MYVLLLCPFIYRCTFVLLPCLSYCKQCCNEDWRARVLLDHVFLLIHAQEWDCNVNMITLFLVFWGTSILFSILAVPIYILSILSPAFIVLGFFWWWPSQTTLVVKNLPASAGGVRDMGWPRVRRRPGGGNGNPLQCCCLENPMDRGAWWVTVHRVSKSQTQLKRFVTHAWGYISVVLICIYLIISNVKHLSVLTQFDQCLESL